MNREILFRVWDIVEKCYLPEDVYCILNRTEFRAFGQMIKDWRDYKEGEYFFDDSQILEQFTGLTDKNGVKIFEGDILLSESWGSNTRSKRKTHIVERGRVGWLAAGYNGEVKVKPSLDTKSDWQVIGNIHDNKELIKE